MGDETRDGSLTRREILETLGLAGGGTVLLQAAAGLGITTRLEAQYPAMPAGGGEGRHVVVLGAGVAGLSAAWELQRAGYRCTVLEARPLVGGRSLTLRRGNELLEEPLEPYVDTGASSSLQRCGFLPSDAEGYDRPYLNAGPGRIPSAHIHVLDTCRALDVPLEVYVMESRSNLVRGENGPTRVNRHIANDARGWIAQALWQLAPVVPGLDASQRSALRDLLIVFGSLSETDSAGWKYLGSSRSGYVKLPGVHPGVEVDTLPLEEILESRFWRTSFYQPEDFLWQPTLFQPVGGMDRIAKALAEAVGDANIRLEEPVTRIEYLGDGSGWRVATRGGQIEADAVISNVPLPLLRPALGDLAAQPFPPRFTKALETVFALEPTGVDGFLAPTCKVGWQTRRELWQEPDPDVDRVVGIYGGISWTHEPMTQLWYPSDRFFDELGVLTGAYNFSQNATVWGRHSPHWRLEQAKAQAGRLAGRRFADGLDTDPRAGLGLSIAWQNIAHIRGGWAQWQNVPNRVETYNALLAGDRDHSFYICGDQMSQLPGWQEGAIASALHATRMLAVSTYTAPRVESVPDSRIMVEGMVPMELDG